MSFVRNRDSKAGSASFRRAAKRRAASKKSSRGGGRRGPVEGQFERFRTDVKMQWIHVVPQIYEYPTYDRDEGAVIEVSRPFYEFVQHYYPKRRRFINCSAGPHRDKPCYPDAIIKQWWEEKDRIKEEMKVKPSYDDKPISRSARFAMAVTGVDTYYEVPAMDSNGRVKTSKAGNAIKNYVPKSLIKIHRGVEYPSKFGHNMHWNFGSEHLEQLLAIDDQLMDACANCATSMHTESLQCADCGHVEVEFDELIIGPDLLELRKDTGMCSKCGSSDVVPLIECSGCGEPEEGGLMDFEIRICHEEIGENKVLLKMKDWRLPTDDERIQELVNHPLDIMALYAPEPIKLQKAILGDICEGVDPTYGAWDSPDEEKTEGHAEGYGNNDEEMYD